MCRKWVNKVFIQVDGGGGEMNLPVLLRDAWSCSVRSLQTPPENQLFSASSLLNVSLSGTLTCPGVSAASWLVVPWNADLRSASTSSSTNHIHSISAEDQHLSLLPPPSQVTSRHTPVNKRPRWLGEQVRTAVIGCLVSRWVGGGAAAQGPIKQTKGV